MRETSDRFTSKVDDYNRYRWRYASEAIDWITEVSGVGADSVVIDLGAGSGILSRLFAERVAKVIAVEPNREMRSAGRRSLAAYPNVILIDGYADATTLPSCCADLVVVGRALHWFDPAPTRAELLRVMRPTRWLAVLQLPCRDERLVSALRAIRTRDNGWDVDGDKSKRPKTPRAFYYGSDDYLVRAFPATVVEQWPQFLGRQLSISSAPDRDQPAFERFRQAARRVFDRFSEDGRIVIPVATEVTIGQVRTETDER